jgi:hypothetical protein
MELHIEQGPVLERENLAVGIVTAISGATRMRVELLGLAGHAGTVPMGQRRDALAGAAEIIAYVEKRCSGTPGGCASNSATPASLQRGSTTQARPWTPATDASGSTRPLPSSSSTPTVGTAAILVTNNGVCAPYAPRARARGCVGGRVCVSECACTQACVPDTSWRRPRRVVQGDDPSRNHTGRFNYTQTYTHATHVSVCAAARVQAAESAV